MSQSDPLLLRRKRSCEDGLRETSPSKSILTKLDDRLLSQTADRRKRESRETSPLAAEIGDPGNFSGDSVYFSDFSLAFP